MKTTLKSNILLLYILLVVGLLSGCVAKLNMTEQQQNADMNMQQGRFEEAFKQYENLIQQWNNQNPQENNPYYDKAGHALLGMGDTEKAIAFFSQSMHYGTASEQTYNQLITYYKEIENISREMIIIEAFAEAYPNSDKLTVVNNRLFEIYVETAQWEKANKQWMHVSAKQDEHLMEMYLEVNKRLGQNETSDLIAQELIRLNPGNIAALEWNARKYYNRAEARYAKELEAYEQNKTRRQYAQLLEGYEVAGRDYRKARDIYEALYRHNPDRRYAVYLHNIYARFQDEEKAAFYRSKMQKD